MTLISTTAGLSPDRELPGGEYNLHQRIKTPAPVTPHLAGPPHMTQLSLGLLLCLIVCHTVVFSRSYFEFNE